MKASSAKENILKKIRQALANPVPVPFQSNEGNSSLFNSAGQELEFEFAENFTSLLGKFFFCTDFTELVLQLNKLIQAYRLEFLICQEEGLKQLLIKAGLRAGFSTDIEVAEASITSCEMLIARTGSVLLSSALSSGRTVSLFPPIHICIAFTSQLVYDLKEGLQITKEKYSGNLPSFITLATGPSRTADIEKTLVVGVHGPKEVFVFLIEDQV